MVEPIPCQTCGELFTPRTSGGKPQVRCSEKCRRKVANASYIAARAPERAGTCGECGGPVVQPSRGRPRKFCSDECKARSHNRRQRRARLPMREPNPATRSCAYCNTEFIPRRRDQVYCPGKYCAQYAYEARRKAGEPLRQVEQIKQCQECGVDFTAHKSNARWCSRSCKNRHTNRAMARLRTPGTGHIPYTDREIFERDGWRCHLCRKKVNRDVPRTHPDGATIDHLVPISEGGTDTPANVATAHWRCNHEKRERARNDQLALL